MGDKKTAPQKPAGRRRGGDSVDDDKAADALVAYGSLQDGLALGNGCDQPVGVHGGDLGVLNGPGDGLLRAVHAHLDGGADLGGELVDGLALVLIDGAQAQLLLRRLRQGSGHVDGAGGGLGAVGGGDGDGGGAGDSGGDQAGVIHGGHVGVAAGPEDVLCAGDGEGGGFRLVQVQGGLVQGQGRCGSKSAMRKVFAKVK